MSSSSTPTNSDKEDWQSRCLALRKAQWASIPKEWILTDPPQDYKCSVLDVPRTCGILTARELEITEEVDVEVILDKLARAEWSAEEVTRAFAKRACVAHQLTNCLTEIFIDRALERARYLDEQLRVTGRTVGPLHGLPISLKDQFKIKGLQTVMGYVAGIGDIAEEYSVLVTILEECGAVLYVRTNVPQTLMWGETNNHPYGRTLNPYNRTLTPGGSSGGEGALLAMKGSPLGVGTDIGGSLRIPSAFCNLYTLRPSMGRLPYYGAHNALIGQESIQSVLGPMSNSLSGLRVFMESVLGKAPWEVDPGCLRIPWRVDDVDVGVNEKGDGGGKEKLCFAIMWDNGVVRPHPPLVRAMEMVKSALEDAGHRVIDWECHRHLEIYTNAETFFIADGNEDYLTQCARSGEPLITTMIPEAGEGVHEYLDNNSAEGVDAVHKMHEAVLKAHEYDEAHRAHKPFVKHLVGDPPVHLSTYELWQLNEERRQLRKSHLDHWNRTKERTGTGRPVDAIISPAVPYVAVPHGLNFDAFYTTLCNSLDLTTSVFPVTHVDPKLDVPHEPHDFYNYEDEVIFKLYNTDLFKGCPVGLQLIGKTLEEEEVLGMTEIVVRALNDWKRKK